MLRKKASLRGLSLNDNDHETLAVTSNCAEFSRKGKSNKFGIPKSGAMDEDSECTIWEVAKLDKHRETVSWWSIEFWYRGKFNSFRFVVTLAVMKVPEKATRTSFKSTRQSLVLLDLMLTSASGLPAARKTSQKVWMLMHVWISSDYTSDVSCDWLEISPQHSSWAASTLKSYRYYLSRLSDGKRRFSEVKRRHLKGTEVVKDVQKSQVDPEELHQNCVVIVTIFRAKKNLTTFIFILSVS